MSIIIPVSREQLWHLAMTIMTGIHDVFPPDSEDSNDPISKKKLKQNEGLYLMCKTLLGFDFDGNAQIIWLESAKHEKLLTILKGWIWTGHYGTARVNVTKFKSTIAKLCHAFAMTICRCVGKMGDHIL
jgi:hypothetical protein